VTRPCLGAITLDQRGGGIALVSRLLWRVFQDQWPGDSTLVTLLDDSRPLASLHSSTLTRIRFGMRMAALQASRRCDWTMYSHVSLAKVQTQLPPMTRRPYAVFLHGIEVWRALSATEKRILRGARLRVANSAFTARRVESLHPEVGAIHVCPLAILQPAEAPVRRSIAAPLGPRAVIVVARMSAGERYKGHDELLECWPDVLQRVPDAQLVFVGEGDDAERLGSKASALGIASSVMLTGYVSEAELHGFYETAAVFAMPSRSEGFGLVYLEAMSHRLPCIGALDDAAGEVIVDGETGFLVHQADRGALTDRIVRLLCDGTLRRSMGERGHGRLQAQFTYERFAARLRCVIATVPGVPAAWEREAAHRA
jgi:phosphatidylinositol alpha-1,6-mannosyltransferase